MAQRTPVVGGNWKMNLDRRGATDLARAIADRSANWAKTDVVIFPPFPYLDAVNNALRSAAAGPRLKLGAQDFFDQPDGAFTGEVSLSMLRDVGVDVVLVGHSERRHVIGEDDAQVNRKVRAALDAGLEVVLCVGETLQQRQLGQTDAVNAAQTYYGLAGIDGQQMDRVTLAYEPVWAIGTGKTATAQDAQDAHRALRQTLTAMHNERVASAVRIQYGGSVKASNAAALFAQPDIDGGLIGGASLKSSEFLAIIDATTACGAGV